MKQRIFSVFFAILIVLTSITISSAVEPVEALHIINSSHSTITSAQVELAYQTVLARYRRVLSAEMLEKIDRSKISEIAIVEHTSMPDLSDAGLTKAWVDLDSGEVESIQIEVQPEYRLNGRQVGFQTIIEHEFAHAFAYMIGLPNPEQLGHTFQIEDIKSNNFH